MPASLQTIVDEKTKGFIELCLQHEHQHRPSASQVFTHEYLQPPFNDPDDDQPVELRPKADAQACATSAAQSAAAPLPAIATSRGLPSTAACSSAAPSPPRTAAALAIPDSSSVSAAATNEPGRNSLAREHDAAGPSAKGGGEGPVSECKTPDAENEGEPLTSSPSQPSARVHMSQRRSQSGADEEEKSVELTCKITILGEEKTVTFPMVWGKDTPEQVAEEMVEELGLEPTAETLDDIIQQIKDMHPDTCRRVQTSALEMEATPFSLEQAEAPASASTESAGSASGLHEAAANPAQLAPVLPTLSQSVASQLPRASAALGVPAEASGAPLYPSLSAAPDSAVSSLPASAQMPPVAPEPVAAAQSWASRPPPSADVPQSWSSTQAFPSTMPMPPGQSAPGVHFQPGYPAGPPGDVAPMLAPQHVLPPQSNLGSTDLQAPQQQFTQQQLLAAQHELARQQQHAAVAAAAAAEQQQRQHVAAAVAAAEQQQRQVAAAVAAVAEQQQRQQAAAAAAAAAAVAAAEHQQDFARQHAAAQQAAQAAAAQEAARQEAARQEAARQEAARQEAARQDVARQEAARQDVARQEAARQEAARQEAARHEAARHEVARHDAARHEAARHAAASHTFEAEDEGDDDDKLMMAQLLAQQAKEIEDLREKHRKNNERMKKMIQERRGKERSEAAAAAQAAQAAQQAVVAAQAAHQACGGVNGSLAAGIQAQWASQMSAQQGQAAAAASLPPKTVPTGQPSGGASSDLADLNSVASTQGTLHAAIPFTVAHSQSHSFVPSGDAVGSAIQPPQATAPPAQQHMHDAGLAMPQSTAASQPYPAPAPPPMQQAGQQSSGTPMLQHPAPKGAGASPPGLSATPPPPTSAPTPTQAAAPVPPPQPSTANPPDQVSAHALLNTPTSPPKQAE